MRVLVLGGTGAIGEPLVRLLSKRGDEVYVTSRRNRESSGNIRFIQGDAHDLYFLQKELDKNYDVIVDFMIYSTGDFRERSKIYLESTGQYMFLSSARVYADSREPITESSPRLLDVCKDADYLKTDEYALAKARSENILFDSDRKNWTIIRPYITYNTRRLQLGGLELGTWLTAALSGRPLALPKDVGVHETTMTWGGDVAGAMAALIGNSRAAGEVFHITCTDHMTWEDIAKVYIDVIEERTGLCPALYMPDTSDKLSATGVITAQIKYDRMFDRVFDNTKLIKTCGAGKEGVNFLPMKEGLGYCLNEYLNFSEEQKGKKHIVWYDAWLDKSTGEPASLRGIVSTKDKLKYIGYYYAPGLMKILKRLK